MEYSKGNTKKAIGIYMTKERLNDLSCCSSRIVFFFQSTAHDFQFLLRWILFSVISMKLTCLSKGNGFHFPPCHILNLSGFRVLLDCPMDLSALTIFSPLPTGHYPGKTPDSLDVEVDISKRQKEEGPLDAKKLIYAEPWYKTASNLHLWDPSSIDVVLISSAMGMLGLPFLTQSKGFSAKIYATEVTMRLGQLIMEDLVSMHKEFRYFYGTEKSNAPQWMKWEELELLPLALKEVVLGKNGSELAGWMPLYSTSAVKDCIKKVQTLKYGEEACYNGKLVIKAFSSGLEIGSCNWIINGPKRKIALVSSSILFPSHAMEFDYNALQGNDVLLYSNSPSHDVMEGVEHNDASSTSDSSILSWPNSDDVDWKELKEHLLNTDESSDELEKIAFISSSVVASVKSGGSAVIPLNRLGVILQLLEQIALLLQSSMLKVPIYMISSVAAELLAFTNVIPEWLCKQRQDKLFSGEPLFSHVELMKAKQLFVFPAVHSPQLLTNWQEPCIIFCPHWSLRLGPVVHFLRHWSADRNSLLVLEDGPNIDMALLPFKPMEMKVLQCSFLSGIRPEKAQCLLNILQPKILVLPEYLKQGIKISSSTSHPSSVLYYSENETVDLPGLQCDSHLEIAADLATQFSWRKLKQDDESIARLEGQLFIDHGKYRLLPGNKNADASNSDEQLT